MPAKIHNEIVKYPCLRYVVMQARTSKDPSSINLQYNKFAIINTTLRKLNHLRKYLLVYTQKIFGWKQKDNIKKCL